MGQITYNATAFGMSPSAPFYLSGQAVLNPDEKDINLHRFETWQIELKNGTNNIDDHLINLLKTHPSYDYYITNNIVILGSEELAPSLPSTNNGEELAPSPADIIKLSVKQAEPIIKAETNVNLLKKWESDPRTGIKDLVGDRLLELGEMPNV